MDVFQSYWLAMTPIESNELLLAASIASYPNMKKQDRAQMHKELKQQARFLIENSNDKVMTTAEIAENLARKLM